MNEGGQVLPFFIINCFHRHREKVKDRRSDPGKSPLQQATDCRGRYTPSQ